MPEVAPAAPAAAVQPPVSPADLQRALVARENGVTYDAGSQRFSEEQAPAADGTTPATPASGEPAQNAAPANSEAQGEQQPTPVEGGGEVEGEQDASSEAANPEASQPGKHHVARKIDKLTRENAELQRVVQQLLQRGQQQPEPQQAQQPQPTDPKPDRTQFADYEEYLAATAAWNSRQTTARALHQVFGHLAQQAQMAQAAQQATQQVQEFNDRVSNGAKDIKDFATVTAASADVEVAPHVAATLMQGIENPALVLYHLSKNPGEVAKLNQMSPAKVAVRLGAIEANAKRPPAISNAPKPATPVQAKGNVPAEFSDDMTMEQFMAKRNGSRK